MLTYLLTTSYRKCMRFLPPVFCVFVCFYFSFCETIVVLLAFHFLIHLLPFGFYDYLFLDKFSLNICRETAVDLLYAMKAGDGFSAEL